MREIFLSYAREDLAFAERVAGALKEQGYDVWWDSHIPAGPSFRDVIQQEVTTARSVLVLWSTTSVASKWVPDEAAEGLERGVLVAARIDETKPPLGFRGQQVADLSTWNGHADDAEFQRLLRGIEPLVHGASPMPSPRTHDRTDTGRKRARTYLAAGIAVAIAVGILVVGSNLNNSAGKTPAMATQPAKKLVLLMDSYAPDAVYDDRSRAEHRTNLDDLWDVLQPLKERIDIEPILVSTENWNRMESVVEKNPDLVIIHRSAFLGTMNHNTDQEDERFFQFLDTMGVSTRAVILVYTRLRGLTSDESRRQWLDGLETRLPKLAGRLHLFALGDRQSQSFRDNDFVANNLRTAVKTILEGL